MPRQTAKEGGRTNLDRQGKEQFVGQLKELLDRATLMVLVDYRGLTVQQTNKLRRTLRQTDGDSDLVIAKNTLLRRAVEGTDFALAADLMVGPNALLFAYEDPVSPTKVLTDALKEMPKLEIKGGVYAGKLITAAQVAELAKMPSKHELRGMLAGVLAAPMRNLACALAAVPRGLATALAAVRDQKEKEAA